MSKRKKIDLTKLSLNANPSLQPPSSPPENKIGSNSLKSKASQISNFLKLPINDLEDKTEGNDLPGIPLKNGDTSIPDNPKKTAPTIVEQLDIFKKASNNINKLARRKNAAAIQENEITKFLHSNKVNDSIDDFEPPKKVKLTEKKCAPANKKPSNGKAKKKNNLRTARNKNFTDEKIFGELMINQSLTEQVDPDDMQMALALSRSIVESFKIDAPSTHQQNNAPTTSVCRTAEERLSDMQHTLEKFGFKSGYSTADLNTILKVNKNYKRRRKFTKRNLEYVKKPVEDKINGILCANDNNEINHAELENYVVFSKFLDEFKCENRLFKLQSTDLASMSIFNEYYVNNLVEKSTVKCGHLLKNWDKIPCRDKSPVKESVSDNINNDSMANTSNAENSNGAKFMCDIPPRDITKSPDMFSGSDSDYEEDYRLGNKQTDLDNDIADGNNRNTSDKKMMTEIIEVSLSPMEEIVPNIEQQLLTKELKSSETSPLAISEKLEEASVSEEHSKIVHYETYSSEEAKIEPTKSKMSDSCQDLFADVSIDLTLSEEELEIFTKNVDCNESVADYISISSSEEMEEIEQDSPQVGLRLSSKNSLENISENQQLSSDSEKSRQEVESQGSHSVISMDMHLEDKLEVNQSLPLDDGDITVAYEYDENLTQYLNQTQEDLQYDQRDNIISSSDSETSDNDNDELNRSVSAYLFGEYFNINRRTLSKSVSLSNLATGSDDTRNRGDILRLTNVTNNLSQDCNISKDDSFLHKGIECTNSRSIENLKSKNICSQQSSLLVDENTDSSMKISVNKTPKKDDSYDEYDKMVYNYNKLETQSASISSKVTNRCYSSDEVEILSSPYEHSPLKVETSPTVETVITTPKTYRASHNIDQISSPLLTPTTELIADENGDEYIYKTRCISPVPDYSCFEISDIQKELGKYGLKKIKKIPYAIALLEHIYRTTHPIVDHNNTPSQNIKALYKPLKSATKHNSPSFLHTMMLPAASQKQVDRELEILKLKGKFSNVTFATVDADIFAKDNFVVELPDEAYIFPMKPRSSKLHYCPVPLHLAFYNLFKSNSKFKSAILEYVPIELDTLERYFTLIGFKYTRTDLILFLDQRCITYRSDSSIK